MCAVCMCNKWRHISVTTEFWKFSRDDYDDWVFLACDAVLLAAWRRTLHVTLRNVGTYRAFLYEYGGKSFLRNASIHYSNYTASHPARNHSSYGKMCEYELTKVMHLFPLRSVDYRCWNYFRICSMNCVQKIFQILSLMLNGAKNRCLLWDP
jgi:hypothetical protein